MNGKAELKVAGGKLIKVDVQHEGDVLESVKITGDFFIHPEDAIKEIEEDLKGAWLEQVEERVNETAVKLGAELIGFSAKDLQTAIEQAVLKK